MQNKPLLNSLKSITNYPFAMLLAVQVFSVLFYGFMTNSHLSHVIFNGLGLIVPILAVGGFIDCPPPIGLVWF